MRRLFITGTDTNVGKTWVACQVIRQLRSSGRSAGAYKPACSGAIQRNCQRRWEDIDALLSAISAEAAHDPVWTDRICPQRFDAPLAPNLAARQENRTVDQELLVNGVSCWEGLVDYLIIEGAGGLLSPVSDQWLVADLAQKMNSPLLIVAANRLGCIHQTLATMEAAGRRGLPVAALILNSVEPETASVLESTNEEELRRLLPDTPLIRTGHREQWGGSNNDPAVWFSDT